MCGVAKLRGDAEASTDFSSTDSQIVHRINHHRAQAKAKHTMDGVELYARNITAEVPVLAFAALVLCGLCRLSLTSTVRWIRRGSNIFVASQCNNCTAHKYTYRQPINEKPIEETVRVHQTRIVQLALQRTFDRVKFDVVQTASLTKVVTG